jgi:hypothetical protein
MNREALDAALTLGLYIRDDTMLWRVEWRFPFAGEAKLFSDRYLIASLCKK